MSSPIRTPLLLAAAVLLPTAPATPQLARHASRSGPSVVLDVPCPPPNA